MNPDCDQNRWLFHPFLLQQGEKTTDTEWLSMNQLECLDVSEEKMSSPKLAKVDSKFVFPNKEHIKQPYYTDKTDPGNDGRGIKALVPEYVEMAPGPVSKSLQLEEDRSPVDEVRAFFHSGRSNETVKRNVEDYRGRKIVADDSKKMQSACSKIFPSQIRPSRSAKAFSRKSPTGLNAKDVHLVRKTSTHEKRFAPYEKQFRIIDVDKNQNRMENNRSNAKDCQRKGSLVRRPSVKSWSRNSPANFPVDKSNYSKRPFRPHSQGKPRTVNQPEMKAPSPICRVYSRHHAELPGHSASRQLKRKLPTGSVSTRNDHASHRKPSVTANKTKRRPSVLSTKARKHSNEGYHSPAVHSLKSKSRKGSVSPQTTSLCRSLRVIKDIDYIYRRMKEISQEKQMHVDAIHDLEEEEVRLRHVLSHVHGQSQKSLHRNCSAGKAAV